MKLGRVAVAAVVLSAVMFADTKAEAANGSNYIHLMNGVDYYFIKTPTLGNRPGIWRCFPHEMLHAPTLVVDAANPFVGTYAMKINAVHLTVTGSTGFLLQYPIIALSSNAVHCNFFTSGGSLNWGLASVAGLGVGPFIIGPVGNGTTPINLLLIVTGLSITNPGAAPGAIVQLALNLTTLMGSPSTIGVPEGESLTLYIGDNPNCLGPGTMQYWSGSVDEQNLCSSFSFLWSAGTGFVFAFIPVFEWAIGLGSLDATMHTCITDGLTAGVDVGLGDAMSPYWGFNPGFDQGSGSQTISITGTAGGGELLGISVYDEDNQYGGSGRLALCNVMGIDGTASGLGTCVTRPMGPGGVPSGWISLPTGGPDLLGLIKLAPFLPQDPRSVGQLDVLTNALLANAIWIMSVNHNTTPGGMFIPWWPANSGVISGGNMTGFNGGFAIPIPPFPTLPGIQLFFWNWATNASNTAFDHGQNAGHSLSNGYPVLFFP
jgi:hypothetical protein